MTNAIFDYLINLKRVERAVGVFEALAGPEEAADFTRRMDDWLQVPEGGS